MSDVRKHLAEIPPAYARLPEFIRVGSRPADPDRVTNSTSPKRAPLNLAVLDLLDQREKADAEACRTDYDLDRRAGARRQGVLPTLSSWVRLVDSERWDEGDEHQNPPTQRTVEGECGWLTAALDWIAAQKWVDEFEWDLAKILADMNYEMGIMPEKPLLCTKCPKGIALPQDNGTWYRCIDCNWMVVTANEIDRLLEQQRDLSNALPLPQIALEVGRPVSTIKEWKARGWLLPVGKTKRGYVYDLTMAKAVAESSVARPSRKKSA